MADLISQKHIDRIDSAISQIDDILRDYCRQLDDRQTPVSPGVVGFACQIRDEARAIMSRSGVKPVMPDLDPRRPLTPGDLLVGLVMIRNALGEFACRNAPDEFERRRSEGSGLPARG